MIRSITIECNYIENYNEFACQKHQSDGIYVHNYNYV